MGFVEVDDHWSQLASFPWINRCFMWSCDCIGVSSDDGSEVSGPVFYIARMVDCQSDESG